MTKYVIRRVPAGRAMPVVRTARGLAVHSSIYSAREPDDLSPDEAEEVEALVATGRYERVQLSILDIVDGHMNGAAA